MAKTKTPFLSLGAHGSVGGSLTAQKRGQQTLLREKPFPTDPYSLPQAYQRWLYEDYAYLWTQQSPATKQIYATAGSRFHLTGFQYWMKDMLTRLPNIAAMYYLDEKAGATAIDFSRNANHATIIGASPAAGLIDGAFLFDGLNDYLNSGNDASLNIDGIDFTFEAFINIGVIDSNWRCIVSKKGAAAPNKVMQILLHDTEVYFSFWGDDLIVTPGFVVGTWYHLACTYTIATKQQLIYWNGVPFAPRTATVGFTNTDGVNLIFGTRDGDALWYSGRLDHAVLHTRVLDATKILRHSERRYPV